MVNDSPSTSTAIHLSRPRPFRRLFRGIDGCPEEARSGPYLTAVSCNFFRSPPSPLPEVKGWESQTNGPCVSPPCVCMQRHGQASCQVLLLFPRRLKKKKTNPKLPSPPLPSFTSTPRFPLHPLFLSLEHKGKAELLNLNVPRLGRADDEDDRAEVRDEGADLRRSGCYFTGQDSVPSAAEATPAGTRSGILRFHSFGSLSVSYAFNGGIV